MYFFFFLKKISEQSRSTHSLNQKPMSFDFLTPKYKEERFKLKAEEDYRKLEVNQNITSKL